MKVKIIAIGKENSKLVEEFSKEYLKRIPWKFEIIELDPSKKKSIEEVKEHEGELILSKSKPSAYKVLMDESGINLSSVELADHVKKLADNNKSEIEFWIGGANGHGQKIKSAANYKLSLSKMTLPHKVARIMLIEQIYRVYTIISNHPYHK